VQTNRAVVFANGDYSVENSTIANVSSDDFMVCVDGGAKHCLSSGFTPNLLVGDLDSVDARSSAAIKASGAECIEFERDKDASDLELVFDILSDRFFEQVVLLGASGGRTDHQLFNWQLAAAQPWPFELRIVDNYVDAQLVDSARAFDATASTGQLFSVVPMVGQASGVNVSGARFALNDATLTVGSTLGLSNVVTGTRLQVNVADGIVLVMLVHTER